jgi:PAS domain S-box-containing protein
MELGTVTIEIILLLSFSLQLIAAFLAIRLIRFTGIRTVWPVLAVALALMAIRRMVTLAQASGERRVETLDLTAEVIALLTSALVAGAILQLTPLIRDLIAARDALREGEARYRSLFEDSPISLWEEDLSAVKAYIDQLRAEGGTDVGAYLESNPDAVTHARSLMRLVDTNRASVTLYGAESKDHLLTGSSVLYDSTHVEYFSQEFSLLAAGRTHFELEKTGYTMRGEPIDTMVHVAIAPGYEESWAKVFVSIVDISERKRTEAALRHSEATTNAILDAFPDIMFIIDGEGTFLQVFARDSALLLKPASEIVGNKLEDVLLPDWATNTFARVKKVMASGKPDVVDYELDVPAGKRHFEARFSLITPGEVLTIIRDITERKNAEERDLLLKLEQERSRILVAFIQDASQEFGMPLSVLKTGLYVLGRIEDPEKRQSRIDVLERHTTYLEQLVSGMLTMTRLDTSVTLTSWPVDVNSLLRDICNGLQGRIDNAGLTWSLRLDPSLPTIQADPEHLKRAFVNLISNAIIFNNPGGTIALSTQLQDDRIAIRIQDTGIGLAPDHIPLVFNRFFRADPAQRVRGAGLGLSIARKIVELHGGTIEVESELDAGSTFTVFLPITSA